MRVVARIRMLRARPPSILGKLDGNACGKKLRSITHTSTHDGASDVMFPLRQHMSLHVAGFFLNHCIISGAQEQGDGCEKE